MTRISIDQIVRAVAGHFGISRRELFSSRRPHRILLPRMVAMTLAVEAGHSTIDIGFAFNRTRWSVGYSYHAIISRESVWPNLKDAMPSLRSRLGITAPKKLKQGIRH